MAYGCPELQNMQKSYSSAFDNPFSSCWEHFHPSDCFYVAPSSCMKADTSNNIWGGWRTSDVKIASVLILLSKYSHIFSWTQGQDNRRRVVLVLTFTALQQLLQYRLGTARRRQIFIPWSFLCRRFTCRSFHLSWCWGKKYVCMCLHT